MIRLRFVVAALVCACSGAPKPTSYQLVVSTDFTADQSAAIIDAATEWQLRSGGFVTFEGAASTFAAIHIDPATVEALTLEFGGGTIGLESSQGNGSVSIQLVQNLDPRTFHQTALHEIGHAIGLHHLTPGNIMCADTTCATLDVRCGDLTALTGTSVAGCIP